MTPGFGSSGCSCVPAPAAGTWARSVRILASRASTPARHLSALVAAEPVLQTRRGREVRNRADFAAARALADFLLSECCAGLPHPPAGSGPLPEPAEWPMRGPSPNPGRAP